MTLKSNNLKNIKKRFNIFIGISLGNKFFTKENIKKYVSWALKNTKKKILIIIADEIQAHNYEVRNKYSAKRALNVSLRKGEKLYQEIETILNEYPKEKSSLIKVVRWKNITETKNYQKSKKAIYFEFENNLQFRKDVLDICKENILSSQSLFNLGQIEKLALYVLDELPLFLEGVTYRGDFYCLHPYPHLSKIHKLILKIQNKEICPSLNKRLKIKKVVIVELK